MTMSATNQPIKDRRWQQLSLRTKLFMASALLATSILLIATVIINNLVVKQVRQQVQNEVENLLPVYDAAWEENARSLAAIGAMMANSSMAKTVFGNERAARDNATIHELMADLSSDSTARIDLTLISDGAGKVTFAELQGKTEHPINDLTGAREVAATQKQNQGFTIFDGALYQLVLTPILLQSGNTEYQNTLAVLGTGAELDRAGASTIQQRIHSEVCFLIGDKIYASSFAPDAEKSLAQLLVLPEIRRAEANKPIEVRINGISHLAFARQLVDFAGQRIGQVVMFRSLEQAGKLFRSISNLLLLLWTGSIAVAFVLSYLLAERITRPIDSLIQTTREVGSGNYDYQIKADTHGELGELARAFDQRRNSLKQTQTELLKRERLATIGQMAGSIIHDLRNPLATISTSAEILSREGIALERRQTLVESQLRASKRMQEMLFELLDFTRGKYNLHLARHSLSEIVERGVRGVNSQAQRSGAIIETSVAAGIFVTVDAERLRRVFENLLVNAIQAMPDEKKERQILIRATCQEQTVRVDVIDNGTGVPAEIHERLFEPFVSHGKMGGTGLGLAIARGIIEAHAGSIGLEVTAQQETDFYFVLPLASDFPSQT